MLLIMKNIAKVGEERIMKHDKLLGFPINECTICGREFLGWVDKPKKYVCDECKGDDENE